MARVIVGFWMVLLCGTMLLGQQQGSTANTLVPRLVRFSGTMKDAAGKPLSSVAGVTFALYKDQAEGPALWIETQNVQPDASGHYTVLLGASKPDGLPSDIFIAGEARWLAVQVQGQEEQPRVLLVAVPYALKAGDADTIGGLPASAFVLAAPTISSGEGSGSATTSTRAPAAPQASSNVTTTGGTVNALPLWTTSTNIQSAAVSQTGSGSTAKIGIGTTTPGATLDVKGAANIQGLLTAPATGTATSAGGKSSQAQDFVASSFNSSTAKAVNQTFQWKAEAAGNNTSTPSGTLNLLFGSGTTAPTETGLKLSNNGLFTFATGQAFPGTGTITGVTAGTDLSGGGTSGNVTLNLNTATTDARYAQLAQPNNYTANQTILGLLTVTATTSSAVSGTGPLGVLGVSTGFMGAGVVGRASDPTGFGVRGFADVGIRGDSNSDHIGVEGEVNAGFGVVGNATTGVGVVGGATTGSGVAGDASDNGGIGVTASATGPGGDGLVASSSSGLAGFFSGDVSVTGNLSKGGGSFKIDHPLDPANKYLYHSFVESPDMMDIYNGNIILDDSGGATVHLPEWFESLNKDFRYQLTAIGAPGPDLYVAGELSGNHFEIAGGKPGGRVSWQVTGIRQDAWANAHRIPVEVVKPEKERGYYIHPELYGAPREKGMLWARHSQAMKHLKASRATQLQPNPTVGRAVRAVRTTGVTTR